MSKQSRLILARERLKPLGVHTAVGHVQNFDKWKKLPFLQRNNGKVPPFIISVGSRTRVLQAPFLLGMKLHSFIDEEAKEKFGLSDYGRVSICIGIVESKGKTFPLMVAESQMGCPAAQINIKELLYHANPEGYHFAGTDYSSDGIYIIRAGTCGGVNSHKRIQPIMEIGDIAIATESIGSIGAILQSKLGMLAFAGIPIPQEAKRSEYAQFTKDGEYLFTSPSSDTIAAIASAAKEHGIKFSTGPNFTKDSLYAEMGEDDFAALRDRYGVISTEMEQMVLDTLASEFTNEGIPVHSALVSAVIGAIPGKSFPETEEEHRAAANAEKKAVILAKEALGEIASRL
ncbi:MAG: nucleoside phosphorylase [bacterium]|nr:nucleoside phosphorylase [bacterium]